MIFHSFDWLFFKLIQIARKAVKQNERKKFIVKEVSILILYLYFVISDSQVLPPLAPPLALS